MPGVAAIKADALISFFGYFVEILFGGGVAAHRHRKLVRRNAIAQCRRYFTPNANLQRD
jgi:hypothetical protein